MRRLGLDRIWWLVTPGNPLKANDGLPPLAERIAAARRVAKHPRIDVTGLEAVIGTRYTADTLAWLLRRCPGVKFVWLMGADGLLDFHRWRDWRAMASLVPIAVIDRPGATLRAAQSQAATALAAYRIDETDGRILPLLEPPAWIILHGPRSSLSSTRLRAESRAHKRR